MGSFFGNTHTATVELKLLSAFLPDEDFNEFTRTDDKCVFPLGRKMTFVASNEVIRFRRQSALRKSIVALIWRDLEFFRLIDFGRFAMNQTKGVFNYRR